MQQRSTAHPTTRPVARRIAQALGLALSAGLVLSGCSAPAETAPEPSASESAQAVAVPDTRVGARVQWFLDLLNGDADIVAGDLDSVLTAEFLAEVPAEDFAKQLNQQFRPAKPFTPTAYEGTETSAVTTLAGAIADPFQLEITVNDADEIAGLFVRPASEP